MSFVPYENAEFASGRGLAAIILWLRNDLELSKICGTIHERLLNHIQNDALFTSEIIDALRAPEAGGQFRITDTDPSQVVLIKKVLNALHNTSETLERLENIDLSADRYTVGLAVEALPKLYTGIHEVVAAIQLVSDSDDAIQSVIAPHMQLLIPKMNQALTQMNALQPGITAGGVGGVIASGVQMLPESRPGQAEANDNLSYAIATLPRVFESMQNMLARSMDELPKEEVTAEQAAARVKRRAAGLKKDFDALSESTMFLSDILPTGGLIRHILGESAAIINTALPLTKTSYKAACAKLNVIRHEYTPRLISELEAVEESLGLDKGVLVNPALASMEAYYQSLAEQVEQLAVVSGVIEDSAGYLRLPVVRQLRVLVGGAGIYPEKLKKIKSEKNLTNLQDEGFVQKVTAARRERLEAAQYEAAEATGLKAAVERFFSKFEELFPEASYYQDGIKNLPVRDKLELAAYYRAAQPAIARQDKAMDASLVLALAVSPEDLEAAEDVPEEVVEAVAPEIAADNSWGSWWTSTVNAVSAGLGAVQEGLAAGYAVVSPLLWESEYTKIAALKTKTLSAVEQRVVDANFRIRAVQRSYENAVKSGDELMRVASTTPTVAAEERTAKDYFHASCECAHEARHLEAVEVKVDVLFKKLAAVNQKVNFKRLPKKEQKEIRALYKAIQPHLLEISDETRAFAATMKEAFKRQSKTNIEDLNEASVAVTEAIHTKKETVEREATEFMAQYEHARDLLPEARELLPADVPEKETLLSRLKAQNLSGKLGAFIEEQFVPGLKEHLSNALLEELDLDHMKPPFTDLYSGSEQAIMYRKMYQSLYHLKTALETFEGLADTEGKTWTYGRTVFFWNALMAVVSDGLGAYYFLDEVASSPDIQAILKDGLNIIEPLKENPLLSTYFRTAPEEVIAPVVPEVQNIEALWHAQQAIVAVAQGRAQPTTAPAPEVADVADVDAAVEDKAVATEWQDAAKRYLSNLYLLPDAIQSCDTSESGSTDEEVSYSAESADTDAEALIESLEGLSFGPKSLKTLLELNANLQGAVADVGVSARETMLNCLKDVRGRFGTELMAAADHAELGVGVMPGRVTDGLKAQFDAFYEGLVMGMPSRTPQEKLTLVVDTTLEVKRLELARAQKKALEDTPSASAEISAVCQGAIARFKTVKEDLSRLTEAQRALLLLEAIPDKTSERFLEAKEAYEAQYGGLQDAEMGEVSVDALLLNRKAQLDREIHDVKLNFLDTYAVLQPYLFKVNYIYNMDSLLRELQTTADFQQWTDKILKCETALSQLAAAADKTKALKLEMYTAQIGHLEHELAKTCELNAAKVDTFKEDCFEAAVDEKIRALLPAEGMGIFESVGFQMIKAEKEAMLTELKDKTLPGLDMQVDIMAGCTHAVNEGVPNDLIDTLSPVVKEAVDLLVMVNQARVRVETELSNLDKNYDVDNVPAMQRRAQLVAYQTMISELSLKPYDKSQIEACVKVLDIDKAEKKTWHHTMSIYQQLQTIEAQFEKHPHKDEKKQAEKLKIITAAKSVLASEDKPSPKARLEALKEVLTPSAMKTLFKGSHNVVVYHLKKLRDLLFKVFGQTVDKQKTKARYQQRKDVNALDKEVKESAKHKDKPEAPHTPEQGAPAP